MHTMRQGTSIGPCRVADDVFVFCLREVLCLFAGR